MKYQQPFFLTRHIGKIILVMVGMALIAACSSAPRPTRVPTPIPTPFITSTPFGEQDLSETMTEDANQMEEAGSSDASEAAGEEPEPEPVESTSERIPLVGAVVLRNEIFLDIKKQAVQRDVSSELRREIENIEIFSGLWEDVEWSEERLWREEEMLMLFSADNIAEANGLFSLTLHVEGNGFEQAVLVVSNGEILHNDGKYVAILEVMTNGEITAYWGYTRFPELRTMHMMEDDVNGQPVITQQFHQTIFDNQNGNIIEVGEENGWRTIAVSLPSGMIEQAKGINQCEQFVDLLDDRLNNGSNGFLFWQENLVNTTIIQEAVNDSAAQYLEGEAYQVSVETRTDTFNVNPPADPIVRHNIGLITDNGRVVPAIVNCAVGNG